MKTAHEDVKQHNCEFCSKTYFSLDNLKKHVETIHNKDRDQNHDRDQEEILKNNDDSFGDNHDDQEIKKVSRSADIENSKQTADNKSENEDFVVAEKEEKGEKEEDIESLLSSNSDLEIDVNDDEPTDELSTKSNEHNSSDNDEEEAEDFEISFKKDKKAADKFSEQSQSQE